LNEEQVERLRADFKREAEALLQEAKDALDQLQETHRRSVKIALGVGGAVGLSVGFLAGLIVGHVTAYEGDCYA